MTWDGNTLAGIAEADLREWRAAYTCDVDAELRKMACWLAANPTRARKRNWKRFATNWLARSKPTPRKAVTCALQPAQQPEVLIFE